MVLTMSDEQKRFCERFDRFVQERIAPRASEVDRTGVVPPQTWAELRDFGYFRMFHPKDVGGLGTDSAVVMSVMQSLAKACGSTYAHATMSSLLAGKMIATVATPKQVERFLMPIVSGAKIGCVGVAETGSNHDPANWLTSVRKAGSNWIVNGAKVRISNGASADTCLLVARYEPANDSDTERGLRFVLLDLNKKGVTRFRVPAIGLCGSTWGGILFDNVEVPAEDVCPVDFGKVIEFTEWGQVLMALGAVGMAEAALEASVEFSASRPSFGLPLGHLQTMQRMLASMRVQIDASRELSAKTFAMKHGSKGPVTDLAPLCKVTATEMSIRVAETAMLLHGGWGGTKHFVVERLYRDCMANVAGGAANDQLRDRIGMKVTERDPNAPPPPLDWLGGNGLTVHPQDSGALPGPTPHTRMYASRTVTAFEWSAADRSLLAEVFCGPRSLHTIEIANNMWERLATIAVGMGTTRESLLNQAIHEFVRQHADFPHL
jgi:alkylation response protein AidB-like acyl-CoA dehydrogenase